MASPLLVAVTTFLLFTDRTGSQVMLDFVANNYLKVFRSDRQIDYRTACGVYVVLSFRVSFPSLLSSRSIVLIHC